jgi:hypothetical protein
MQARPVSAIVFGILNIGFGVFNLLALWLLQVMASDKIAAHSPLKAFYGDPRQLHWMWVSGVINAVAGLLLAAAGVGLLLGQNWGRLTSLAWAVLDILFVLASVPFSWKYAQMASPQYGDILALFLTVFGLVLTLAYPVALLIFMTRPKLVAACRGEGPQATTDAR